MTTSSITEARASFCRIVDSVARAHERLQVTRRCPGCGDPRRRRADALLETVEVLPEAGAAQEARRALAEFDQGDSVSLDGARGRLRQLGRIAWSPTPTRFATKVCLGRFVGRRAAAIRHSMKELSPSPGRQGRRACGTIRP